MTRRLAIACGNSTIEPSMGSAAKLATAASKLGGAFEQSSVKSSMSDRKGWDGSRQYLCVPVMLMRCASRPLAETLFFDTWLKDSHDQPRQFLQVCKLLASHVIRGPRTTHQIQVFGYGGLECILGPALCFLKTAIDEHSSFRQASLLPLTLSFVRVTSTTTTPTLNTADPRRKPQHKLKLPRPSSRMQSTLAPGNCNGVPGVPE